MRNKEEKRINNLKDRIISVIEKMKMKDEDVEEVYHSIKVKDCFFPHYMREQKIWIEQLRLDMNKKYRRDMSNEKEFLDEIYNNLSPIFRFYFAAERRDKIKISKNEKTEPFLYKIQEAIRNINNYGLLL